MPKSGLCANYDLNSTCVDNFKIINDQVHFHYGPSRYLHYGEQSVKFTSCGAIPLKDRVCYQGVDLLVLFNHLQ